MLKSDITLNKHTTRQRVFMIMISFSLATILLLFNIFRLDYLLYDHYRDKAFDQITTTSALKAERGNIYDVNMNILATTKTSWRIFVSTKEINKKSKEFTANSCFDYHYYYIFLQVLEHVQLLNNKFP